MRAPLAAPARDHWKPVDCQAIAPARDDTRLHQCDVLADHLVLTVRRARRAAARDHRPRRRRSSARSRRACSPGAIRMEHAEDYDRGSVIIAEESLIEPTAWYELDLATGTRELLKRMEVPGYDPARYRTERRTARAPDGTPIPVTLARSRGRRAGRQRAVPAVRLRRLRGHARLRSSTAACPSLLDRGVVYAIAHIRGGGEGGRRWWQQGRLQAKPTTFTRLSSRSPTGWPETAGRPWSTAPGS